MPKVTTRILIVLQLCLFGAAGVGCGSDSKRGSEAQAGTSGSGGASQGGPTGTAGVSGAGGLQGNGGTNGAGASGGTIGQPPPGSARVRFVLKEVH